MTALDMSQEEERMIEEIESSAITTLRDALSEIEKTSRRPTDGKWLERLTANCAPLIAEWDVREACTWEEWSHESHPDSGIDVVATRSDGKLIAIQCKSRELNDQGSGAPINKGEINSFIAESSATGVSFAELWLVVNGGVNVNANAQRIMEGNKVAHVNLYADITKHLDGVGAPRVEDCPHCQTPGAMQTRDCMQREAVRISVAALKGHAQSGTGAARGRIILPCGTGKSRIALQVIEELTEPGQISAILCPSIALVAQLRREFLIHSRRPLVALAVCSDQTAARGSDLSKDQTADLSQASTRDVKGRVTTEPGEIAEWMGTMPEGHMGVIFGTYQSSHKIAEALKSSGITIAVLVADEAHRTAGIRRVKGEDERLRDFTVCHRQLHFPATYRVYQTATPKIYKTPRQRNAERRMQNEDWIVSSMDNENVFGPELYRRSYRDAVENEWLSDYRIIALGVNDPEAYRTANELAAQKTPLSTVQFLRGLALALVMGGATRNDGHVIRSSINFLNTIKKSKDMTRALGSRTAYLLVTSGQNTATGRLTAVVREERCVGVGWLPVPAVTLEKAKAASVFLNSTAGRLQLLRNPGRMLAFPKYEPAGLKVIRLPDLSDSDLVEELARCWHATAETEVPQYRDGECDVRRILDDAVADALGWDKDWLSGLRHLLHREPHVRGLGYNQFG